LRTQGRALESRPVRNGKRRTDLARADHRLDLRRTARRRRPCRQPQDDSGRRSRPSSSRSASWRRARLARETRTRIAQKESGSRVHRAVVASTSRSGFETSAIAKRHALRLAARELRSDGRGCSDDRQRSRSVASTSSGSGRATRPSRSARGSRGRGRAPSQHCADDAGARHGTRSGGATEDSPSTLAGPSRRAAYDRRFDVPASRAEQRGVSPAQRGDDDAADRLDRPGGLREVVSRCPGLTHRALMNFLPPRTSKVLRTVLLVRRCQHGLHERGEE